MGWRGGVLWVSAGNGVWEWAGRVGGGDGEAWAGVARGVGQVPRAGGADGIGVGAGRGGSVRVLWGVVAGGGGGVRPWGAMNC